MTGVRPIAAQTVASRVLALVLPLLVLGGGVGGVLAYKHPSELEELANAGNVLNGKIVREGVVSTIDRRMKANPRVIVLGNSLANTNLSLNVLSRQLDVDPTDIVRFSVPNSIGAHWYAMLKHRVFGAGYRPELVLVVADLRSTVATQPVSMASQQNLDVHLTDGDVEVFERVGSNNIHYKRLIANRQLLRDRALSELRNLAVDVGFFQRAPQGQATHERTVLALGRVFDNTQVDTTLHADVMPTFASNLTGDTMSSIALPAPEDSFVPLLAALTAEHGAQLVFVRPPFAPSVPDRLADHAPPEVKRGVRALLAPFGHHLLDLRGANMNDGHYYNADHMHDHGARRFTMITAELLRARGVLGLSRTSGLPLLDPLDLGTDDLAWRPPRVKAAAKAPPVTVPVGELMAGAGRTSFMRVPALRHLSDLATAMVTPYGSRCSPVRVTEAGVPLPKPNVSCEEVFRLGAGRMCHTNDRVIFVPAHGVPALRAGGPYGLAFSDERACDGSLWLHPGDALTMEIAAWRRTVNDGPWTSLWVDGHRIGAPTAGVVAVEAEWASGARALWGELPAEALDDGEAELVVEVTELPARLHLFNRSSSPVLLTRMHLASWASQR